MYIFVVSIEFQGHAQFYYCCHIKGIWLAWSRWYLSCV